MEKTSSETRFAAAVKKHFGAKSFKFVGTAYRGGYVDLKIGKTSMSLADVKRRLRFAMYRTKVTVQRGDLFGTRKLSIDGSPEFYVKTKDWMAVVTLHGSATKASLHISFTG